jgi:membrane-bound lytic murein transglycosylase F
MKYMIRSDYHSFSGGNLSQYDQVIKEVAGEIGWDWRLLASLVYQESNFKADAENWSGAYGLMQLMPSVMQQFGIDSTATPADQLRVGGKYISYLDRLIPESVTDSIERAKFVIAAYNTGVGHVLDARRLAEKYNKNPNIWTDNVDFFSRNKSKPTFYNDQVVYYGYARGEETYDFVTDIFDRYENYKNLINK